MARMHILQQTAANRYDVVVHATTPVGNNDAGVSFATAMVNAGLATTRMATGNGPGQITTAEGNLVANGSLIETSFPWDDNPAWTNAERLADLNIRATQAVAAVITDYSARLKQFGRTVT